MTASNKNFWHFSLKTYRQAGVEDVCLVLQDQYGADVNLLLYCCWAGTCGITLDDETFERALAYSREWARHVVHPLRAVRRWMKTDGCRSELVDSKTCMDLREKVKRVELDAEKEQQSVLDSLLQSVRDDDQGIPSPAAAAANLRLYFDLCGIDWSDEIRTKLHVILRAAFPEETAFELKD